MMEHKEGYYEENPSQLPILKVNTSIRAEPNKEISSGLLLASASGFLVSITGQFVRDLLLTLTFVHRIGKNSESSTDRQHETGQSDAIDSPRT
jgi:hypothetical protein